MSVLHLRGHIELADGVFCSEAWLVDEVLTVSRPERRPDRVLDGWVVPGLVDVHCHIGLVATGASTEQVAVEQAITNRDSGVLLIRDAGSPLDTRWLQQRRDLPHLIRSGTHIARPKRYLRNFGVDLEDVNQLPDEVRKQARRGDGWVKLVADWIDRSDGAAADLKPLWPNEVLAEAVAVAHEEGARVTAHAFATESIDGLLDAGIDCIEHGTGLTAQQISRVVSQDVAVTPTLLQVGQFASIAEQAAAKYPQYAARMRRMFDDRYAQVRRLHAAGVQLLVGTDAGGTIEHGLIAQECAELVRAGVPTAEVLRAATWQTRRYLGVPDIHPGDRPGLVVYAADPRSDIKVLQRPRAVVLGGRIVAENLAE